MKDSSTDRQQTTLASLSPGTTAVVAAVVLLSHMLIFAWLRSANIADPPDFEPAEVTVQLVPAQSLAVPTEVPTQEPVQEPQPQPEPLPEPEPVPEPEPIPDPTPELVPEPPPEPTAEPEQEPPPEPAPEPEPEPQPLSQQQPTEPLPETPPEVAPADALSVPTQGETEPVEGMDNPTPPYPPEAYFDQLSGTVLLRVRVNADGGVGDVQVKQSSGHSILDESALTAVREWTFRPARDKGVEVAQWVEIPITFELR